MVYEHANLMWIMGWRIAKHVLFFAAGTKGPEIIKTNNNGGNAAAELGRRAENLNREAVKGH